MWYNNRKLFPFSVDKPLELSPGIIKKNPEEVQQLFQAALVTSLDISIDKLPDIFFYLLERIVPYDTGLLYIWEPRKRWFCRGIEERIPSNIETGNMFTKFLRDTMQPLLITDSNTLDIPKEEFPLDFSSMIGLPIYIDTRSIGCVELYRKKGRPFNFDDLVLTKNLILYSEKALIDSLEFGKSIDNTLDIRIDTPQKSIILDILHQYEEQARRLSYELSVALIAIRDLYKFGLSLDTNAGARTLKLLAKKLKANLRCYDKVIRYDESSFFVILPGCSTNQAKAVVKNAMHSLGEGTSNNILSGIATFPIEAQDSRALHNAVIQSLSHAKKNGSDCVSFSDTGIMDPLNQSLELEVKRLLCSVPTINELNSLLNIIKLQTQASEISIKEHPPGRVIKWENKIMGYLLIKGLSDEVYGWIVTYLTPAWAVAERLDNDIRNWYTSIMIIASLLSDIRAAYPMGYSLRVSDHMYTLAKKLGMKEPVANRWAISSLAANIGYLGIPTSLFTKTKVGYFDTSSIRKHPIISSSMIKDLPILLDLDREIVEYHHENLDGSGYPRGLKGEEIPLGARAYRLVDTFNAITSPRLYRQGLPHESAVDELKRLSEQHIIDPDITSVYMDIICS